MTARARALVLAVAVPVLLGFAAWYAVRAGRSDGEAIEGVAASVPADVPAMLVLDSHGYLAELAGGTRTATTVRRDRSYAAAGTVACLRPNTTFTGYRLVVLDRGLRELRTVGVAGLANRVRVSASGRMVAWTTFVSGDTYVGSAFSTRTGVLDTRTGKVTRSLEGFAITREGEPYRAADVNFWGVTFATDDNRFYATMATRGTRYLVVGDYARRTVRTLKAGVECPGLSPDGTRVAFKSAVGGDPRRGWRVSVLDLATLRVTPLAETRSVDDQATWLDDDTVAYALQRPDGIDDVWTVPADGRGTSALLVPDARSPAALAG